MKNMSELIQIKKLLTLEDIAPNWARSIKMGDYNREELNQNKYCVVGEAHGYADRYGCEKCNGFSYGGMTHYRDGAPAHDNFIDILGRLTPEELNNHPTVQALVKHWNEKHV